ncbi:hypothetical protein H4W81_002393 [Nonomuraea africana]|uniref:Uncharacterized protein n=1 Tax=Nonomuraea africana TaxID=46171 RepID=A0ABR9KC82_9ACTN|nr:hypothetical protein [Nonomuraea africana]
METSAAWRIRRHKTVVTNSSRRFAAMSPPLP